MYGEITSDLLCICERLLNINKDYRVFWNGRDERFEVHVGTNPNFLTLAFCIPYERLDTRTLDYARKTRRENADILEQEVLLHNLEIEKSAHRSLERAQMTLEDMLQYANRASHSVVFAKRNYKEF